MSETDEPILAAGPSFAIYTFLASSLACTVTPKAALMERVTLEPVVTIDSGGIVGNERAAVREFLGIPFAAAPVGTQRWKPPAPVPRWETPRNTTRRGAACPQPNTGFTRQTSEDCLTVNVWTPAATSSAHLPVLVWIHGGAFFQGSGGDEFYDGALLAIHAQAVVVTMNYRLGGLGFMSHRALAVEAGRAVSPSHGLLDQQAALRWVQRNVASFGGDPAKVTIFGESAGAWSVCSHLVMPGSRGLFASAIIQSGACSDPLYFGPERAHAQADALAKALGCDGDGALECLRAKSADMITKALPMKRGLVLPPGVWWGPVVDGVDLPRQPLHAIRTGNFAHVPVIVGWNRDEGTALTSSLTAVSSADVESFVRDSFGANAVFPAVRRYARATAKESLTDIFTDGVMACSARRVTRVLAAQGIPVFLYEWTRALDSPKVHGLGATHSVELFFLWGNAGNGISLSHQELPLSVSMMETWGRFARFGDPSAPSLPWLRYSAVRDELILLDLQTSTQAHVKQEVCDFWDDIESAASRPAR